MSRIKILFVGLYYLTIAAFKLDSCKYTSLICIVITTRNMYTLIVKELHVSDNGFTLYRVNCIILVNVIFHLKLVSVSTVCVTILSLHCPLLKFTKHYYFVFRTVPIIREFEC